MHNLMKNPWAGCHCWLPSCIAFRMHEKDTTTETKYVSTVQITLGQVLGQRSEQCTKWRMCK